MARLARLFAPGLPVLALQRVKDGELLIRNDGDAETLMRILMSASQAASLELHAFVLLPTEMQLLCSALEQRALSTTLQQLGRSYVAAYNRRYQRTGTLWAGRFRSTVIEPESWLLDAMAAIENAPLFAGLADDAAHYPWSSYRQHVGLSGELPLTDHREYWRLGNTPFERQRVYLSRTRDAPAAAIRDQLLAHVHGGWALGSPEFIRALEQSGTRRSQPQKRGRPARQNPPN